MALADKNLYNCPSDWSLRELFRRRLGVSLDPDLVSYSYSDTPVPTITVTAKAAASDGTRGPYLGSVSFPLTKVSVGPQLPTTLVWSEDYPMSVDALAEYLLQAYGYYLEDGEFFGVGDVTQTPLVRGGTVNATVDPDTHCFRLQATTQSVRWAPGSTLTFLRAISNSQAGLDSLVFVGVPPDGAVGEPYDFTYQVAGARLPVTFEVEQGMAPAPLNPFTGKLYAPMLETAGTFHWIVRVTDADGQIARQDSTVHVAAPPLVFNPPTANPILTVGQPVAIDLGVSGGEEPLTYEVYSGSLPDTLDFVDGQIVGITDGNLNASLTALTLALGIRITDAVGATASRIITLTINDRSVSDIRASLLSKLLHWFPTPPVALAQDDLWYDAMGRANLTVEGAWGLVVGPNGAGALDATYGTASANTVAYNATKNVALVTWAKVVNPSSGQAPLSRGAREQGQYEMAIGLGADSGWALGVTLDEVGYQSEFPAMVGVGNWAHNVLQLVNDVPMLVTNAGIPITGAPLSGTLSPNATEPLTLGTSASGMPGTKYMGQLASAAVFNDALWSDERKWLYQAGQVRKFCDLQLYPALIVTADPVPAATVGTALSMQVNVQGSTGIFPGGARVTSGALPAGVNISSLEGQSAFTVSGTPTVAGTFSAVLTVTGSDEQTATIPLTFEVASDVEPLVIAGTFAMATVGVTYNSDLTISGGDGMYTNLHLLSGALPAWASLSVIGSKIHVTGTPTNPGQINVYAFTLTVNSGDGQNAQFDASIPVSFGNQVSALLHFEGPDGSTTFTDEVGNLWSAQDNLLVPPAGALLSSAQAVFGLSSGRFPGVVCGPFGTKFDLMGGSFTLECFLNPTGMPVSSAQDNRIILALAGADNAFNSTGGNHLVIRITKTGALMVQLWAGKLLTFFSPDLTVVGSGWQHFVVCKDATSLRVYWAGQKVIDVPAATVVSRPSGLPRISLGRVITSLSAANDWQGYIDELRVVKGTCVYSGNVITPPSSAFFYL